MQLESEVKLDFSGAAQLAANMRAAASYTAQMRANLTAAQRDTGSIIRQLQTARMPGLPGAGGGPSVHQQMREAARTQTADRLALAGTAAAGSAFMFRATQLANPTAMRRFNEAVEDTIAVIGHRLIPALEMMTRFVRGVGDWLAGHPAAATAIGYGTLGLAGLATAGTLYAGGKLAVRGLRGAYTDIRGAFGFGPSAAAAEVGGINRAEMASAQIAAMQREAQLTREIGSAKAAELASGGLGAAPHIRANRAQAEKELSALQAARSKSAISLTKTEAAVGGAAAARAAPGLLGRLGMAGSTAAAGGEAAAGAGGLGGLAGTLALPLAAAAFGTYVSSAQTPGGALSRLTLGMLPGEDYVKRNLSERNQARLQSLWMDLHGLMNVPFIQRLNPFSEGTGESRGAAARPAKYNDVLGSLMEMQQEIASGAGVDAQKETAKNTSEMLGIMRGEEKAGGGPGGEGNWMINPLGPWADIAKGLYSRAFGSSRSTDSDR